MYVYAHIAMSYKDTGNLKATLRALRMLFSVARWINTSKLSHIVATVIQVITYSVWFFLLTFQSLS